MKRTFLIRRTHYMSEATLGVLTVRGDHDVALYECVTLELPWKENKRRVSCIPIGTYRIELERSKAFDRELWELKDVPGRSEVKIHPANYVHQLQGCIAPGMRFGNLDGDETPDIVGSTAALNRIMAAMGDVKSSTITILGHQEQHAT